VGAVVGGRRRRRRRRRRQKFAVGVVVEVVLDRWEVQCLACGKHSLVV